MIFDDFLVYLFSFSTLSATTQKIYMQWVTRCCQHYGVTHCLDVTPEQLDAYRLFLLNDLHYSPSSDTIVYNAFQHTYTVLLPLVDAKSAAMYASLFQNPPRQPYRLPRYADRDMMRCFCDALPLSVAGYILRRMYATSQPFEQAAQGWKCSKVYAQQVAAITARLVGIPHGFGLSGIRATSIIHRLQSRLSDAELAQIRQDSELSPSQFARYMQVAQRSQT